MIQTDINLFTPVELGLFALSGGMAFYTWIYHILSNFVTDILVPVKNEPLGVDLFHEANFQASPSGCLTLFLKEHVGQWSSKEVINCWRKKEKERNDIIQNSVYV